MAYYGNQPIAGETNSFKVLDDISSYTKTFDGSSAAVVSTSDDTLTFYDHRFIQGQRVTYGKGGGTVVTGLTDATVYYVIRHDKDTIKLATSASNAATLTAVNLTGVGAGASHTLIVAFDGTNTKFKATTGGGTHIKLTRPGQLMISMNGVVQEPQNNTPTNGFGIESNNVIVFSTAPTVLDTFWGHYLTSNLSSWEMSDNKVDNFTGDASTTTFTLSKTPANAENILVTVDGVIQYPSESGTTRAYTLNASIVTFTTAPALNAAIQVRHIGFAGGGSGGGSGGVTGFYGRTGNVSVIRSDLQNTDINLKNLTGVAATFTGNVSIGGTLTYTDVTNIDSIGIVTAQKGINVITNGINVQAGVATFAGDIDANADIELAGNLAVTGVSTFTGAIDANSAVVLSNNNALHFMGTSADDLDSILRESSSNTLLINSRNDTILNIDSNGDGTDAHFAVGHGAATGSSSELFRVQENGKVGIGTDNPDALLHLQSASSPTIHLEDTTQTTKLKFYAQDSSTVIGNYSNHALQFVSNSLSRIQLTNDGKVQIGLPGNSSSLPGAVDSVSIRARDEGNLHIRDIGNLTSSPAGTGVGIDVLNNASNAVKDLCIRASTLIFRHASAETLRITSDGRLLAGTATSKSAGSGQYAKLNIEGGTGTTENFVSFSRAEAASAMSADDEVANLTFNDSAGYEFARIQVLADAATGATDTPGRIVFKTTADGASSATERLRITSGGTVHTKMTGTVPTWLGETFACREKFSVFQGANFAEACFNIDVDNSQSFLSHNLYYNSGWKTKKTSNSSLQLEMGGSGFRFLFGTDGGNDGASTLAEKVSITSAGNVSIHSGAYGGGGTAPQLYVVGTGGRQLKIHNTAAGTSMLNITNGTTGQGDDAGTQLFTQGSTGDFWIQSHFATADLVFATKASGASSTEKLRITSAGEVAINTTDPLFGQSTPISTHSPKLGIEGSILIGSLSTGTTTRNQLQFYRRNGAGTGSPISSHMMGDIAWYGSSNDGNNSNLAWSIGVTATGGDWTSGGNRTGRMLFSNHDGEMARFSELGVFCGRDLVNRSSGSGNWENSGQWKVIVDLNGWPTDALYMCDAQMQHSGAYTATFWVYKSTNSHYAIIHDEDSLLHWRLNGTQLELQQNSGADQTNTFGVQKVFMTLGMHIPAT